jgi:hypothetical protein
MFVGHLAVALGAKRVSPDVPLGATVAAALGMDLIWPILLLLGVETVRVNPGDTAFTNLAFDAYPWSHSLLTVVAWSVLVGFLGRRILNSGRTGVTLGVLFLSHWVLDFATHRPDLPLWPDGPLVGLGLWNSVPGTILVEGCLLTGGLWLYHRATFAKDRIGTGALAGLVALTGLIWVTQPWTPPPGSATAVAGGSLILWLLLPWAAWIERHRSVEEGGV